MIRLYSHFIYLESPFSLPTLTFSMAGAQEEAIKKAKTVQVMTCTSPFWPAPLHSEAWSFQSSWLPPHLQTIVEDTTAPQEPRCPLKCTSRGREVKPLRWAGDDSQNKRRCPLSVQEVNSHLHEKELYTHSFQDRSHLPSYISLSTQTRVWLPGTAPFLMFVDNRNYQLPSLFILLLEIESRSLYMLNKCSTMSYTSNILSLELWSVPRQFFQLAHSLPVF